MTCQWRHTQCILTPDAYFTPTKYQNYTCSASSSGTVQLSEGDQWTSEGDTTDVGPEVSDKLDHVTHLIVSEVGVLDHVLSNARHHSGESHQAVESCHQLRQGGDLDRARDAQTCDDATMPVHVTRKLPVNKEPLTRDASDRHSCNHLGQKFRWRGDAAQSGWDTPSNPNDPERVSCPGRGLLGQTTKGPDAA